jgi:hypothetical protein
VLDKPVYMLETPKSVIPRRGKAMTIGQSAGKNYAYLLGVYLGDGCVTRNGNKLCFRLNTIDEDFALAVQQAIRNYESDSSICKYNVKKSSKPNYALYCGNESLCIALRRDTDNKLMVPDFSNYSDDAVKDFIVGIMDSKGFVAEKTMNKTGRAYYMGYKSCDDWVPDLISLMQRVGLKIGKVSRCPPYKPHYKTPTRFHIKMQSWVESGMRFSIKRKQDRVDRWANTEPYSERSRFPRKLASETIRQGAYESA